MTSTGAYPPGCTQRDVDEAQPGYWDPPQTWAVCEACGGEGMVYYTVQVYERGCGFPHDDVEGELCGCCNGAGGWMEDVEPDDV